jgi:hypothetical protein
VLAARKFLRNLKVWTWDFQRKITSDGEWAPCVFLALARKNSSSVFFFFFSQSIIDSWKIREGCWEKILSCFFCFCQLLILGRSISISVPGCWPISAMKKIYAWSRRYQQPENGFFCCFMHWILSNWQVPHLYIVDRECY